jgi:hypothetical protein
MKMLGRKSFVGLVAAIVATACLGFASWGFHKSSERGTEVTFPTMTKFNNGAKLPAGTYWMEVPKNSQTPEVKFYKENVQTAEEGAANTTVVGGKVMATIKAEIVTQQKKNATTEIDSVARGDAQIVKAIRPAGWDLEVVFGSAGE